MKKTILVLGGVLQVFLFSCSTTKSAIDNSIVLKDYQAPYKIFGIGNWSQGYSILTLTDAGNKYFVIKTLNLDSPKVGSEYKPR